MHRDPDRIQNIQLAVQRGQEEQGVNLSYGPSHRPQAGPGDQIHQDHNQRVGQQEPPAAGRARRAESRYYRDNGQVPEQQ